MTALATHERGHPAFECPNPGAEACRFGMLEEDCATLRDRVVWMVRVRRYVVFMATCAVVAGMVLYPDAALWFALILVVTVLGAFNFLWQNLTFEKGSTACHGAIRFATNQIIVDFALLTVGIHLTGGVTGPLTPLFALHGIFSAVLLPRRHTVRTIGLAVLFMLLSFALQHVVGWMPKWRFDDPAFDPRWLGSALRLGFLMAATVGAVMIGVDISRQLRARHSRIAALARELERRNTELHQVDEQRVRLLGAASHDLKSPLGAIELKLDLFLGGYLGEVSGAQREQFSLMKARIGALRAFINDLLDLTAIESHGTATETVADVDIAAQMRDAAAELDEVARRQSLNVALDLPEGHVVVRAPPNRLAVVWSNLMSNAVKYGAGGGTVEFVLRADAGKAVAIFTDHGLGIAATDQAQLFTDFFRARAARDKGIPGTGLGLSIVKRVIDSVGGTVGVKSEIGKGSTFTVTLPLAETKK